MKVAVIGGGVFGVCAALELSKIADVTLFEKEKDILLVASTNNHFRHHHGYHYPRSEKTVIESIDSRESFEREFGECVLEKFPNYYSVTKEKSLTSPEDYLKFCDSMNLPYEVVNPDIEIINPEMVALTIKVPESSYDPEKLKAACKEKLNDSSVRLRTCHELIRGRIVGKDKELIFKASNEIIEEKFDYVINATYAGFNQFNKALGLPKKTAQYELMELVEFEIPGKIFGCMNLDGPFASILPKGNGGRFTVAHVEESVLKRIISDDFNGKVEDFGEVKSNSKRIITESANHFPILNKAKIIGSIFITKVVKAGVDKTDERPSEIMEHGNGIYSIFSGKVITAVNISHKISKMIEMNNLKNKDPEIVLDLK